jgi:hypothetical protein
MTASLRPCTADCFWRQRLTPIEVLQPDEPRGGLRGPAVSMGQTDPAGGLLQSASMLPAGCG